MPPTALLLVLLLLGSQASQPPEKPPDSSSDRVSIRGCLRGRNLTAIEPGEVEPVRTTVEPGRVFRLTGKKQVLDDLKKRDRSAVEVTGLVRRNTLDAGRQGMPIAGGRIRIGGTPMNQDPTRVDPRRDPLANVDYLDVESFRPIDAVCRDR
jgi:hypothetical protein